MLRDMMESILKNSDAVLGVEWKSGPNSSELLLEQEDGHGRMVFHPLFTAPQEEVSFFWMTEPTFT